MRFIADEGCDFRVVRALRDAGHDVVAVAEIAARASDAYVMRLAVEEGRILLTEDRDLGQLIRAGVETSPGVVYIRFPATMRALLPSTILDLVTVHGAKIVGAFAVVRPGRVRVSRGRIA